MESIRPGNHIAPANEPARSTAPQSTLTEPDAMIQLKLRTVRKVTPDQIRSPPDKINMMANASAGVVAENAGLQPANRTDPDTAWKIALQISKLSP